MSFTPSNDDIPPVGIDGLNQPIFTPIEMLFDNRLLAKLLYCTDVLTNSLRALFSSDGNPPGN